MLSAVQQDLQRSSVTRSGGVGNSNTTYNPSDQGILARSLYGKNFEGNMGTKVLGALTGSAIGAAVGHPIYGAGVGTALTHMGVNALGKKYNAQLAETLMNPEIAAATLARQQAIAGQQSLPKALQNVPLLSSLK